MTLTCFSFTKPYLTHICKTHIYLTPTLPDEESDNDDSTCSGIEIIDTAAYARLRTTIVISRDKCNAFTSLWVVGKVYYRVMHHCVYTRYMCWYASCSAVALSAGVVCCIRHYEYQKLVSPSIAPHNGFQLHIGIRNGFKYIIFCFLHLFHICIKK